MTANVRAALFRFAARARETGGDAWPPQSAVRRCLRTPRIEATRATPTKKSVSRATAKEQTLLTTFARRCVWRVSALPIAVATISAAAGVSVLVVVTARSPA